MKKQIILLFLFLIIFGLTACGGNINEAKVMGKESEIYASTEINFAIETIKQEFKKDWKGCTLKEIYYAGDDITRAHQDWVDRNNAEDIIVLLSSFDVDSSGGDGSLNPNITYDDWMWILVRNTGEGWKHVDHGY